MVRVVKQGEVPDEGLVAPPDDVVEVLGFRSMRLTLRIIALEASSAPQVGIWMETGMEAGKKANDPTGFASLGMFDLIGEGPTSVQRVFTDLQRYVRWRVFTLEGGDATVQFTIEGVVYS